MRGSGERRWEDAGRLVRELIGAGFCFLGSLDLCNITLFVQLCGYVDMWAFWVEGEKRRCAV
jgi:hypothetical protein